jgi:hypothetical protein
MQSRAAQSFHQATTPRNERAEAVRVAILGWGSLLWEGGADFDQQHDPWHYDGPTLKLEFSRISQTRLGALTLVIDDEHGTSTTVAWCVSKRASLEDVICDLRCREGTTVANIGRLTVTPGSQKPSAGEPEHPILAWARLKKVDAVVWTALRSNFTETTKQPFSVDSVVSYVKTLKPDAKAKAAEYVWCAPDFVQTPVRSVLQREPWFSDAGS